MEERVPEPSNAGSAIAELIERLDRASGPDREIDRLIDNHLNPPIIEDVDLPPGFGGGFDMDHWGAPYTASVDAAVGLIERVLPGRYWSVDGWNGTHIACCWERNPSTDRAMVIAPTPALALCKALLLTLSRHRDGSGTPSPKLNTARQAAYEASRR